MIAKLGNKKIIWDYILIYLVLLFKTGFYFIGAGNSITAPILFILLLLTCIKRHNHVDKNVFNIVVVLFILFNITGVFQGYPATSLFINYLLVLFTSMCLVTLFGRFEYLCKFSDVIFAISVVSLGAWVVMAVGIPISQFFPALVRDDGFYVHHAILTCIPTYTFEGSIRTQGIFWEPGAFQIMIIISMIVDIYRNDIEKIWCRRLIFTFTLVTTFSTTGLMCVLFVYLLIFNEVKKYRALFTVSFIMAILFLFVNMISSDSDLFNRIFMQKYTEAIDYEYGSGSLGTAAVRIDGVVVPIMHFLESPIIGIGEVGYERMSKIVGHTMFTCTPINLWVKYGFFYGLICYIGLFRTMNLKNKNFKEAFLLVLALLLCVSSEELAYNTILVTFVLFGFKKNDYYSIQYKYLNKIR